MAERREAGGAGCSDVRKAIKSPFEADWGHVHRKAAVRTAKEVVLWHVPLSRLPGQGFSERDVH